MLRLCCSSCVALTLAWYLPPFSSCHHYGHCYASHSTFFCSHYTDGRAESLQSCCPETSNADCGLVLCRVESIVQHLRHVNPETPILLLGLTALREEEDPNADGLYQWPNKYTAGLVAFNEDLERVAIREDHVHYQDCLGVLLSDDGVCCLPLFQCDTVFSCSPLSCYATISHSLLHAAPNRRH